jgi:osmotically-inducible protein OsmY
MKKILLTLLVTTFGTTLLQGCGPVVVGGAATGVAVVHDRRSAGTALDDQTIELKALNAVMQDKELDQHSDLTATSYNNVVLLTGQADSESYRDRYVAHIRKIELVKRVVNEVSIGPKASLQEHTNDIYITSKVKLELFSVKLPDFDPTRVKVVTEKGIVYLLGLVSPQEAEAVVEKIRYLRGVKQVVKVFEYL